MPRLRRCEQLVDSVLAAQPKKLSTAISQSAGTPGLLREMLGTSGSYFPVYRASRQRFSATGIGKLAATEPSQETSCVQRDPVPHITLATTQHRQDTQNRDRIKLARAILTELLALGFTDQPVPCIGGDLSNTANKSFQDFGNDLIACRAHAQAKLALGLVSFLCGLQDNLLAFACAASQNLANGSGQLLSAALLRLAELQCTACKYLQVSQALPTSCKVGRRWCQLKLTANSHSD